MEPGDIKRLRQSLGWSQERLAREVGVSFCTVNRWEKGRSSPSQMAQKILGRLKEQNGAVNRRTAYRVERRYPIYIRRYARGEAESAQAKPMVREFTAYTENLSYSGLMFKTPHELRNGETVRIDLDLGQNATVSTVSEVRWSKENGAGKYVGVRFNEIGQNDLALVMNTLLLN